jgi:hypothetical protein
MTRAETLFGIEDFARSYVLGIRHHSEIRTEHLAEAFRSYFKLQPFPSLAHLNQLCDKLGASLQALPEWAPMDGANTWVLGKRPEVHIRSDLGKKRTETTVGHEIRELIETAFVRVSPGYVGLDTADNKTMNRESDHFAACLLMQARESKALLARLGFDLPRFADETGRSLSSVVLRLQDLFSVASGEEHPHAGVWLFEAPWEAVEQRTASPSIMTAKYEAKMCGFSQKRSGGQGATLARAAFPLKGCKLTSYGFGLLSLHDRRPMLEYVSGFDLFGEHDFTVVTEPLPTGGAPSRLLVVAVRNDSAPLFRSWVQRLPIHASIVGATS